MASLDDIERALRAADASGNTDDARQLAQAYAQMKGAAASAPPQPKPNRLLDAVRSAPGGLAKGVSALAGLPGDVAAFGRSAGRAPEAEPTTLLGKIERMTRLPTGGDIAGAVAQPFGGYYEPQTNAGKYAETIASFAPAAAVPGSMAMRAARAVVPGAASELGGQALEGTSAEPYARVGGALLGTGGVAALPAMARTGARVANRAVNAVSGREFLDPEAIARERLNASLRRDGGVPALQQNVNDWAASGASNPSLIDVTGNNTRRLVRAAASGPSGDAQNTATRYADNIAGNLQDRASGHVRNLTPGRHDTAEATTQGLKDARDQIATRDYAAPYAEPATVTPDMVDALQGDAGRRAIGRALASAGDNRNVQQMGELRDLLKVAGQQSGGRNLLTGRVQSLEDALQNVSAGTLDRVRIAMRETGRRYAAAGSNDRARGHFGRVTDIDTALDQTPGLRPARAQYRKMSQQIEAVDTGKGALNAPSSEYVPAVNAMSPDTIWEAAQVGHKQALLDAIERPAQGATGTLNRIATSQQQGQNLAATFGQPAADRLRAGVGNEVDRLRNARFVSPNTGSQTALRADELSLVDAIPTSKVGLLTHAITALKNGLTLTDTQRAAIVRLGTSERDIHSFIRAMPRQQPQRIATQVLLSARSAQSQRPQ